MATAHLSEPVLPTPPCTVESSVHNPKPSKQSQRRWHSADLLGGAQEAEIQHGKALYRLRLTSLGKLILVK